MGKSEWVSECNTKWGGTEIVSHFHLFKERGLVVAIMVRVCPFMGGAVGPPPPSLSPLVSGPVGGPGRDLLAEGREAVQWGHTAPRAFGDNGGRCVPLPPPSFLALDVTPHGCSLLTNCTT